ncbi:lysozyme inhibitor LprI family protein [Pararhodobacter sp. SW119]|uniref:lysozyme inhibitor LprI family protein n=1 Tax=Pararhodobacter sp. SW119 TaxID=2780075 RepID=UPI001ADFC7ED|nr:lysozyme inhibitor LprI family protein [Pararhodobacter sp. SW119]
MRALALLVLMLAGPASAEIRDFDPAPLAACVERGNAAGCAGSAARACMDASPAGHTTLGINGCLDAELGWWDDLLNTRYGQAIAAARRQDAAARQAGLDQPSVEAALRAMQRTWIVFHDASCDYAALQWWGGTGASGAYLGCRLNLTAEQALRLGGAE